jgi:hypothetical protein
MNEQTFVEKIVDLYSTVGTKNFHEFTIKLMDNNIYGVEIYPEKIYLCHNYVLFTINLDVWTNTCTLMDYIYECINYLTIKKIEYPNIIIEKLYGFENEDPPFVDQNICPICIETIEEEHYTFFNCRKHMSHKQCKYNYKKTSHSIKFGCPFQCSITN